MVAGFIIMVILGAAVLAPFAIFIEMLRDIF